MSDLTSGFISLCWYASSETCPGAKIINCVFYHIYNSDSMQISHAKAPIGCHLVSMVTVEKEKKKKKTALVVWPSA